MIISLLGTGLFPVTPVYAQALPGMPAPGTRVGITRSFAPPVMKGVMLKADKPFEFDFLIDTGDNALTDSEVAAESERLIKYFLASLAVPEEDLWVNLSPYEKDQTIPQTFGITEMGRDLLAQDYLLKQLTASLMYPEDATGRAFWDRVYKTAQARYGTTDIPLHTFNKVWIVPEEAVVYERDNAAFVVRTRLKVLLEEEYVRMKEGATNQRLGITGDGQGGGVTAEMVREVLIPEIEREVNEGAHFARLRQVYHSLILASWYKQAIKRSLVNQIYSGQNKISGVDVDDKEIKEKIYQQYLAAFQKGVYDYIREDLDPATGETVPRKYFSGGFGLSATPRVLKRVDTGADFAMTGEARIVTAAFDPVGGTAIVDGADQSMLARPRTLTLNGGRGARFHTRLNEKIFAVIPQMKPGHYLRLRDGEVGLAQLQRDRRPFPPNAVTLTEVQRGLGMDIAARVAQLDALRRMHPDDAVRERPITIVDWRAGRGRVLRQLRSELRRRGITNVRLVGLSDRAYPEWKELPSGIEMILDKGGRIDAYLNKGEVDLIYSYSGLGRFRMSRTYFSKLASLLSPGGELVFNHGRDVAAQNFSADFQTVSQRADVLRLRKKTFTDAEVTANAVSLEADSAVLAAGPITLDENRVRDTVNPETRANMQAAVRYFNRQIISGRLGQDIPQMNERHYTLLLGLMGFDTDQIGDHIYDRPEGILAQVNALYEKPEEITNAAFKIYMDLGLRVQDGNKGFRRMGWLMLNYFLIRHGVEPYYLRGFEGVELPRLSKLIFESVSDSAQFGEVGYAFNAAEWSTKYGRAHVRKVFRENGIAMTLEEARTWRAAKPEYFEYPFNLPAGFWDSQETTRNMLRAALFEIDGFEEAYRDGDIKTMARLYRKEVIDFPATDGRQGGQTTFWKERGYAGTLLSNAYSYFGNQKGTPRLMLQLAFPDVKLIDEENPDALWPMELEKMDWSDAALGRKYILNALYQVPGFRDAHRRGTIKEMADLYRTWVIGYAPEDTERFENGGQVTFFIERGRLGGLMSKKRVYLKSKSNSPAALLRYAVPELIDISNPDALDPVEVDKGYWDEEDNARHHVFAMLDAIRDDELGSFATARAVGDMDRMVELYAKKVIPYEAPNPGPQQRGGQTLYFYKVGGLKALMIRAKPYLETKDYYSVADVLQKFFPKFLTALRAAGHKVGNGDEAVLAAEYEIPPELRWSLAGELLRLLNEGFRTADDLAVNLHTRNKYRLLQRLGFVRQLRENDFEWSEALARKSPAVRAALFTRAEVLRQPLGLTDADDRRNIGAWVAANFPDGDTSVLNELTGAGLDIVFRLTEEDLLPEDPTRLQQYNVLLGKTVRGIDQAAGRIARRLDDERLAEQIMSINEDINYLAANAVDAVMERFGDDYRRGEIRFRMAVRDGALWMQVLDNGTGLMGQTLPQLVSQDGPSRKADGEYFGGKGVGLNVAYFSSGVMGYRLLLTDREDLPAGETGAVLSFRIPLSQGADEAITVIDAGRLRPGVRDATAAGLRAAVEYLNESVFAGNTGAAVRALTAEDYAALLDRLGLHYGARKQHLAGLLAFPDLLKKVNAIEADPGRVPAEAFGLYQRYSAVDLGRGLGYRRMGWLLLNYYLVRNGSVPYYMDTDHNITFTQLLKHVGDHTADEAVFAQSREPQTKGGIDLTPDTLRVEVLRDDAGLPVPFTDAQLQHIHIDGLVPVIINVQPVLNLPLLLGQGELQFQTAGRY
ncbi:MAG: hypothetical protein H6756_00525 [Candidatus Omnitrophica bacterium]|nr:hypothetical protein [Candidatus Omnitrophota bacterium]